ncbi:hypothetical protein [Anaerobacillus alkaliphilus]|uniref:hypothetical protein n=1 Tax=Anaerobacillus alkaliphilus TaxID=1548597 RepID=UPI001375828B|nr:hypothetical protein [Anaerobacillus alkaliphilus]
MRKPKTDKLLKGIVGTTVALASLSGCGVTRHDLVGIPEYRNDNVEVVEVPALPSPEEADCDTWTWDEEAEGYQCAQPNSPRHGHYYYGGMWFPTVAAFMAGRATAGGRTGTGVTNRTTPPPNQQVTQPRTNTNTSPNTGNITTNPRSGMGGGGTFGG